MRKFIIAFYIALPLVLVGALIIINSENSELNYSLEDYLLVDSSVEHTAFFNNSLTFEANKNAEKCFKYPVLQKSFTAFKEAVGFKESGGNYFTTNEFGYLGKYQFGKGTLALIGVKNLNGFLDNPNLQEKAFLANAMRNKWILRRDIKRFRGKRIDGLLVTESGILAAAHLAGPGSVKKYLRSYGAIGFTDAYGTSIKNYMKRFSGYDTSNILADKKAKVSKI